MSSREKSDKVLFQRARMFRLAAAGVMAAVVNGVAAMHANPDANASSGQQNVTSSLLDDPLAKFAKLMPDVVHPRCQNCHGVVDPFTGANHPGDRIEEPEASRIRDAFGDHNFSLDSKFDPTLGIPREFNKACRSCHDDPRAELWGLAPQFKSFVGKTPHEICLLWQTTKHNKKAELLGHFNGDPLAALAFEGSPGIKDVKEQAPPLDKAAFLKLAEEWLKDTDDIPCAGWEGTITQTERVNLTTDHTEFSGDLRQHTVETQDATRTITITVNGGASLRIAVQGMQRIDTTITAGSGAQACTATALTVRSWGTNGVDTSGDAERAELTFRPGGKYALGIDGPEEHITRVERMSTKLCGPPPFDTNETLKFDPPAWTIDIDGVLTNPSDRTQLKGTKTETVTKEDEAWLTHLGQVTPLQMSNSGELLPVPVTVTTTWDLRRRINN